MSVQKDIIVKNIRVLSDKEVSVINNYVDDDYIFAALTVEGGGSFKKGISIGIQDKMVNGLIIYDNENFYGFSEKFGLSLLSQHNEYTYLEIPDNIFDDESIINKLQPVGDDKSSNFKDLKDTEKNKSLNIDLNIKDVNNFYIIIPKIYENNGFNLTFNINYVYDLNSIISNLTLSFINESNKNANFKIINDNFYYEDNNFNSIILGNCINKLNMEVINENYFMINTKIYKK